MREKFDDPVFMISVMFAITQILGITAGILLLSAASVDEQVRQLSVSPLSDANDPINGILYVGYILFGAAFALFLIKFVKFKFSFKLLELAMVGGSVSVLIFAYLYHLLGADFLVALPTSMFLGGLFSLAKFFFARLKNIAAVLSSAGVGALFGYSMGFIPAIIFIIGISLYDYIAVFKTKHMLVLAENLGSTDMSFTVTAGSKKHVSKSVPSTVVKKTVHVKSHVPPTAVAKKHHGGFERIDLGSGDLAVPAMLAVSTYSVAGIFGAISVAIGTTISIYYLLKFVEKRRVVLPALPPICLGGMLALLLVVLIQSFI